MRPNAIRVNVVCKKRRKERSDVREPNQRQKLMGKPGVSAIYNV